MAVSDPLPDFESIASSEHPVARLWDVLWPATQCGPSFVAPRLGEQLDISALASFIGTWNPIDVFSNEMSADTGVAAEMDPDMDMADEELPVDYIDLKEHVKLRIRDLDTCSTYIVREEYREFINILNARNARERVFFLTGQPGKSMGAYYLLFLLLASAREIFFLEAEHTVFHFSAYGVQMCTKNDALMADFATLDAVKRSWVIVDVEDNVSEHWLPKKWCKPCFAMVWTSSPRPRRQRHFGKRFDAHVWHMKPWSSKEIKALTCTATIPRKFVQGSTPPVHTVARTLFKSATPDLVSLKSVVDTAFENGIFSLLRTELVDQMFILGPNSSDRSSPVHQFLSDAIIRLITALLPKHFDRIRAQLIEAFEFPDTRPLAGKLVECTLHRALVGNDDDDDAQQDLSADLGGGKVAASIELVGTPKHFVLEARGKDKIAARPLYLRPQLSNFAAVDAIILTDTALTLWQSSVSESYSHILRTMILVLARLCGLGFRTAVQTLALLYCVVGLDERRVRKLMRKASKQLELLKGLPDEELAKELGVDTPVSREQLKKMEVRGYTLHIRQGLQEAQASAANADQRGENLCGDLPVGIEFINASDWATVKSRAEYQLRALRGDFELGDVGRRRKVAIEPRTSTPPPKSVGSARRQNPTPNLDPIVTGQEEGHALQPRLRAARQTTPRPAYFSRTPNVIPHAATNAAAPLPRRANGQQRHRDARGGRRAAASRTRAGRENAYPPRRPHGDPATPQSQSHPQFMIPAGSLRAESGLPGRKTRRAREGRRAAPAP
ncbi:hypothetical protein B0H17DRAFT_1193585 [Mycena rosella]|uniref:Uncharacterized protein n=1 Tax=Mycena rosella TaxID=1033263 RepID=A0AAD7GSK1_MYCRO|nr:hypothetical protein B0H17DRAFT_1193585 [Mycena rosella]